LFIYNILFCPLCHKTSHLIIKAQSKRWIKRWIFMTKWNQLTAAFVKTAKAGKYNDGAGLWLVVHANGSSNWTFRYQMGGRRREPGLGGTKSVTLQQARARAAEGRQLVAQGIDPQEKWKAEKIESSRPKPTLSNIAKEAFESKKAELKGDGVDGKWFSPLKLHIMPKLGDLSVEQLNPADLQSCLAPIWHSKSDTARKALNRTNIVIRHAAALGLSVDVTLAEKAKILLGKSRHQVKHIPFIPWQDTPAFYQSLNETDVSHLALRLLILTGLRTAPVITAHIDEIDGNIWTVPGAKMKGKRGETLDFRVPLSDEALRVIERAKENSKDSYLFPGKRQSTISLDSMAAIMRKRGLEARPHGFRTSLKTWMSETQQVNREVSEMVISHQTGSRIERAYNRTDYFEQRLPLLKRWAEYLKPITDNKFLLPHS
jgi:integrase